MALVTIVIPTYDRLEYIQQALRSVIAQTFGDFVVVVADDAGPNDLSPIISGFCDARISLLRRPVNLGISRNIWDAFSAAKTKYVVTLNDDDLWEPRFLEVLVAGLENNPDVSVAFCDLWIIDENGDTSAETSQMGTRCYGRTDLRHGCTRPFIYEGVWTRTIPAAMGAVFRHAAIAWEDFSDEIGGFYDEWLAYLAVRDGQSVWFTPERLSRYRLHDQSETVTGGQSHSAKLRRRAQEEFITRAKIDDQRVAICHAELKRRLRQTFVGLVVAATLVGPGSFARERLRAARHILPSPLFLAFLAATWTPQRMARLVRSAKDLADLARRRLTARHRLAGASS